MPPPMGHEKVGHTGQGLWHHKGWQLPAYIEHVANDLIASGHSEARAIEMAVGIVKNWAHGHDGKGHVVHPDTQTAAAKAIAEWEALKAKAHAKTNSRSAGMADQGKPYGDVTYADPGYQKDGKKRYPLDTEAHCKAAWSYINQAANAGQYTADQLAAVKGRIRAALKKYGVAVADPGGGSARAEELLPVRACSRTYQLEDMTVRSDGSGRTVESYFAVFTPARSEVMDQDGHYHEENSRSLFSKTLAEHGLNIPVFYNHARTLDGTPAGDLSIPVGVPVEITPDERGVFNAVRYLDNPVADHVLDGIKNGAIRGMSYSGRFIKSAKSYPKGRRDLPLIVRHEAALREFGPTPLPQFKQAAILGTRAEQLLGALLSAPSDRAAAFLEQFEGLTTLGSEPAALITDTPDDGAVDQTEEPHQHSARSLATRIRVARMIRGIGE